MMRTKQIILLIALCCTTALGAKALAWHDALVESLSAEPKIKKSIVVERNPATKRIVRANYKFTFPKTYNDVRQTIADELFGHQKEATKFSCDEDGTILLQVYEVPSTFYNYKLSEDKNEFVFLISVGGSQQPTSETDDQEIKKLEREIRDFNVGDGFGIAFADELFASFETLDDMKVVGVTAMPAHPKQEIAGVMKSGDDRPYEGRVYDMGNGTTRIARYHHTNFDAYGCPLDSVFVLVSADDYYGQHNGKSIGTPQIMVEKAQNVSIIENGKYVPKNALVIVCGDKASEISELTDISPYDIAEISVFKDENTMRNYGVEGKEGVIIITMKEQAFTVKGGGTLKKE